MEFPRTNYFAELMLNGVNVEVETSNKADFIKTIWKLLFGTEELSILLDVNGGDFARQILGEEGEDAVSSERGS